MSFTRRPGSGRPRQTSRREDHIIVRNARVEPTASSAAITPQSCLCFTATHRFHSWCDGMGAIALQYTVTPSIDPWYHDSPAVCP
ncbi:hypothetical protein TNCV_3246181 [Trichonephila clavipes]|nr:hypothetical protein TNCV_3246181 [Trichonephila clavipes]